MFNAMIIDEATNQRQTKGMIFELGLEISQDSTIGMALNLEDLLSTQQCRPRPNFIKFDSYNRNRMMP